MDSPRKRITWADLAPAKPTVDPKFVEAAIQFANENPTSSKRLEMQSIVTRMDDLSKANKLLKNLPLAKHWEAYDMFAANWLMGQPPVSEPQRIVIPLRDPYWATIGK
jgi:hypothetical protein